MKRSLKIKIALACLLPTGLYATGRLGAQPPQNQTKPKAAQQVAASSDEGEKRFQRNCARCHNPPEDLSPREVRAVVRQMRVRGLLTADDEKLIVQYLAP
ncbi:MAG: cytochrome c [Candidatus Acidiferrales bacterium]